MRQLAWAQPRRARAGLNRDNHILKETKVSRDSRNSMHVSNLAQTQRAVPVILDPAECVERVVTPLRSSHLGRRG